MARSRSKVLALVVALGVLLAVGFGLGITFVRQAKSEVSVRVTEMRFSLQDGSGRASGDKSVFGQLARAVGSEVVVDSVIEVDSKWVWLPWNARKIAI